MPAQKFSEELIRIGQEYFEKNHGIKASREEMDSWLDSLAELYAFFADLSIKEIYGSRKS